MWLVSISLVSAVICYSQAEFGDLVVHTDSGTVEGWERISRDGRVYQAWTGIPYAEPPVGKLRFKPPKPKSRWEGELNATDDAPMCLQPASMMGTSGIVGSEDCLYLNVYRPKIRKENMPVMVHVHGGAFQGGSMGPRENADYLMDEDVVFVAIQYRLNALGFMSLGDSVMPGNFGLKDQVLALKWVKRNIVAFGGNPGSVTVFGESAGGASTHILLKSPAADDLVHRAVSDSGTINRFWSLLKPDTIRNHTLLVAEKTGCLSQNSREVLRCLQDLEASVILTNMMAHGSTDLSGQLFMPVIEPEDAEDPVATFDLSLRPTKKPWITSACPGEWLLFKMMMGNKNITGNIRDILVGYLSILPIDMTETQKLGAAEILEKVLFSSSGSSGKRVDELAMMEADMSFHYPIFANILLHQGPKWIYLFEYVGEISRIQLAAMNITGEYAPHASQMETYLNMRSTIPNLSPAETPEDHAVSKRVIKYMVNFAYHDNPTPKSSPFQWKQFKATEILRVTKLGDYFTNEQYLREIGDVYNLFDTTIGWTNKHSL